MSGGLIQLGRFYDITQAHIIRGKIENAGIPCFIFDEHHNATAWHLGIAVGGTRLMVLRDDYEAAREIAAHEMGKFIKDTPRDRAIIRKPYLKTIVGTIIGFFIGAPSIPRSKDDDRGE